MAYNADSHDTKTDPNVEFKQHPPEVSQFRIRAHFLNVVTFLQFFSVSIESQLSVQYVYNRLEEDLYVNHGAVNNLSQPNDSLCADKKQNHVNGSHINEVAEESAQMQIYLTLAGSLPSVCLCVILGSYSDRLGRRLLLVLPIIGTFVRATVYGAVSYWVLSLKYLYIGHSLEGFTGAMPSFLLALFAMTSDITNRGKQRSFRIAIVEASLGLSLGAGSLILGFMIKNCGYVYPNILIMGACLLNMAVVVCVLPETKPRDFAEKPGYTDVRMPLGKAIYRVFHFYFDRKVPNLRLCYILCWLIFFITSITFIGAPSVEILYQKNTPLCWDSVKIGYFGSIKSVCLGLGAIVMLKLLQFCLSDTGIGVVCGLAKIASLVLQGFATTDFTMYLVAVVGLPAIGMMAMVRSIASKLTSKEQLGAMFAGFACTEALTGLTGSILFNSVYKATVAESAGTVFFLMAAILSLVIVLYIILFFVLRNYNRVKQQLDPLSDERRPLLGNSEPKDD